MVNTRDGKHEKSGGNESMQGLFMKRRKYAGEIRRKRGD
ncbi:hypothetical protein HMPREF0578_1328 [Mobiluncus mulieris 28-1]|nr:hypothetical protein HMPREF0578_1328 [Mobiluncus mulieris 28-1]